MDLFNAVVLFDTGFLSLVPHGIRGWLERSREATLYGMAHIQCTVRFPYLPTLRSYLQLPFFFLFPDETRVSLRPRLSFLYRYLGMPMDQSVMEASIDALLSSARSVDGYPRSLYDVGM